MKCIVWGLLRSSASKGSFSPQAWTSPPNSVMTLGKISILWGSTLRGGQHTLREHIQRWPASRAHSKVASTRKVFAGRIGGNKYKGMDVKSSRPTTSNAGEANAKAGIALPSPSLHNRAEGCGGPAVHGRADSIV